MDRNDLNRRLPEVVNSLTDSVLAEPSMRHLNRVLLPSRDTIIECIRQIRQLVFPGYFGHQGLTTENITYRIGELVIELSDILYEQVRCCLRYRRQIPGSDSDGELCEACDSEAARVVSAFFDRLPELRRVLAADVQAAFASDPAA